VKVRIDDCTSSTLLGTAIEKTTLTEAARTDTIVTEAEPAV
jgi:tRNA-2-methylthio-N6-dimethylallyladenosine synthase